MEPMSDHTAARPRPRAFWADIRFLLGIALIIASVAGVWLVVSGTDKAAALGLALAGASYESVPAAGAKGRKRTLFFVDEAAAANVPPELIDQEF